MFLRALYSGVDSRGRIDEGTQANSYGCPAEPSEALTLLSSCTSSPPSALGFSAGRRAFERPLGEQAELTRHALRELWALATDIDILLCPSGTDAEYLPLCLAKTRNTPLCTIVTEPRQLGRGSASAAQGLSFDAVQVLPAPSIASPLGTPVRGVALNLEGNTPELIEAQLHAMVSQSIAAGETVLIHHIAHGKLGVCGPPWDVIQRLRRAHPERVMVVVDAAQGRFRRSELRQWLADDAVVIATGSKFFGGPSFCGAVLVPPAWQPPPNHPIVPASMSGFLSRSDLPRHYDSRTLAHEINAGLLLRWACALAEMQAYYALPAARRIELAAHFHQEATHAFTQSPSTEVVVRGTQASGWPGASVVTFSIRHQGRLLDDAALQRMRKRLATEAPFILLGQASQGTLRAALGAPLVTALATQSTPAVTLSKLFSTLTQSIEHANEYS